MENANEVKQIAAQLLSALLSNPHTYASISDEGVQGRQEQELIAIAIEMGENLISKVNARAN
jgi:hypothetical protein